MVIVRGGYMNKKKMIWLFMASILIITLVSLNCMWKKPEKTETSSLTAQILSVGNRTLTVQDENNIIYTFETDNLEADIGDYVVIKYTGLLDKNNENQTISILNFTVTPAEANQKKQETPDDWMDQGIFSQYYKLAYDKLKTLSLDEKIGQIIIAHYPTTNAIEDLKKYKFGGYIFFEKDFQGKTENEVKKMISDVQKVANIPLLTAVDEEGGTVTRISNNTNLTSSKFKSPSEIYKNGGLEAIKKDTIDKSKILNKLGLNLNFAPVVDVATNPTDYMYKRSLQADTETTSKFAKTVIEASHGTGVSYSLKHFPGYGNNTDTHQASSIDNRTLEELKKNDLPPFQAGIEAKAEAVLVSHNTVTNIDSNNPASLSPSVHNLLRNELSFTGIIITDDLIMKAVSSIDNVTVKAILAGNDMIITGNYEESISQIKKALQDGTLSESQIDKLAFRVLAWKYYKGLMFNESK